MKIRSFHECYIKDETRLHPERFVEKDGLMFRKPDGEGGLYGILQ